MFETFDNLGENKENVAADCLFLAFPDELIKERNEIHDKINHFQM